MAVLAYALASLAEVKTALGISVTSQDLLLEGMIDAGTQLIEGFCQQGFVVRDYVEHYTGGVNGARGGARSIFLNRYPIVAVDSIADESGETVEPEDFTIWPTRGQLEHASTWPAPFSANGGTGKWEIAYTAGRFADTAAVDAALKRALYLAISAWRATSALGGEGIDSKKVGDFSISKGGSGSNVVSPGAALGLPDSVLLLLQPYISRTGG